MTTLAALPLGVAYWFAVAWLGGVREPWDAAGYWTIAYPLSLVVAAILGATSRRRAWTAGALFVLAQAVPLASSGFGPLWAIGAMFLALLTAAGAAAAQIGRRLARRLR